MRKTLTIITPIAALILVAALIMASTLKKASHPTSTPTPSTTLTPQPSTRSPHTRTARGPAASTLTTDITPLEQHAAAFVLAAATPDTRLDPTPTAAWQRAAIYATPTFARQLDTQKNLTADQSWRDLAAHDGWVSIRITNILGTTPQDPDTTTNDHHPDTLQVIFLPTYHTTINGHDTTTNDQHPHTWTLHLHGDRIDDFDPDAQH